MKRIRLFWHIKMAFKRIAFAFARPRYRTGDRVLLWGQLFELAPAERNWKYCYFTYQIDSTFKVNEGVIDYYNNH